MRLQFLTEGVELTPDLESKVQEHLVQPLDSLLPDVDEDIKTAHLRLVKAPRWGWRLSFDLWLPGREHVYAAAKHEDIFYGLVTLRKEVERQLKRYLDRVNDKRVEPAGEI